MAKGEELIEPLMNIAKLSVPLVTGAVVVLILSTLLMTFRERSGANEWLLHIRNGTLLRSGIGISAWRLPGD
jgi:hypothetical protein